MDGVFTAWSLPNTLSDPTLEWEVLHKDVVSVCQKEGGEGLGSDAADRSSVLSFGVVGASPGRSGVGRNVCVIPGKRGVQFRICEEGEIKKQRFVDGGNGGHKDIIVCAAWSKERFVTGGRDGRVFCWEMKEENGDVTGVCLGEVEIVWGEIDRSEGGGVAPITSLVWEEDKIYVADASGAVCVVDAKGDFVKRGENENGAELVEEEQVEQEDEKAEAEDDTRKESGLRRLNKQASSDEFSDDDAMFDEIIDKDATAEKPTAKESTTKKLDASKFIDDEQKTNAEPSSPEKQETAYEDFTQPEPQDNEHDAAQEDADEDMFQTHDDHLDMDPADVYPTANSFPPLQPAFAPSATPINESRRILCWNHVGVVTSYPDPDSSYNIIDVAFHETAGLVGGRRPINFTDNLGFIVGTIGEEGALFASDLVEEEDDDYFDDDGEFENLGVMSEAARKAAKASRRKKKRVDSGKGSQVYFNRFETFGRNADKDWVVALPDGERAVGCATGKGWSGVITR
jgi:chromosome transmission fidelity protein 4